MDDSQMETQVEKVVGEATMVMVLWPRPGDFPWTPAWVF